MRRLLLLLILLAICHPIMTMGPSLPSPTWAEEVHHVAAPPDLVIAHTNDMHAHYRSFKNRNGELRGGFARIAARLQELRGEHGERLIYLDAGDLFQGTPFYNFYRGSLGIELLEAMGCDAMAFGNHELDDGSLNFFRSSLGASFPILCSNLLWNSGEPVLRASTILDAGGLSVEIVGAVTGALAQIVNSKHLADLAVTPPADALRKWLNSRDSEPDLRLVLSHCGLGEDRIVAAAVPEIPLIIGGHSHSFLREPEIVAGVTICHAGCYGYNLGVLECYREDDGSWRFEERLEPVMPDWPEDETVAGMIERAGLIVDREMDFVLADLPEAFSGSQRSSRPDPLGILIADAMRREAGADVGLQNVGGYRTFLPAGPLKREKIFELLPFDNRILKLTFSGVDLQALFDFLAASYESGSFGQIAGASYSIQDGKAREILIGGHPLDREGEYTVATLDFLFGGGDGYTVLTRASHIVTLDLFAREILEARILAGKSPRPSDYPPNFTVLR